MRNCKNKQHFMREFIDKGGTVGNDVWFKAKIKFNVILSKIPKVTNVKPNFLR